MHRIRLHADRLRERAKALGDESDISIAQRTGVTASTVSRLLSGRTTPSAESLVALADAYGIPVDDLLQRPDTEQAAAVHNQTDRVPA
ncbi:helix-turn-helix domain-containing protein [Streptomyces sp. NPDC089424]|uniref:helix-turn-helix domain-containing protein n=1 Tax=Streptomyces sp. NPDC089424 TaxID=3365917 RepID=UPI0037FA49B6